MLSPHQVGHRFESPLSRFFGALHLSGLPVWVRYDLVESLANIALFVPVSFFVALLVRPERRWVVAIGAALASVGVEVCQALFLPERVASVSDILANSAGGVAGVLLAARWGARTHSS